MKKHNLFYGYWVVAVAFLCLFITAGVGLYAFSLFYDPLYEEFGWSRGTISAAFTISFVIQGLVSPPTGRIIERYGVKKVIALGALILGLGFLWLSLMQNLWSFYAGYIVIGLGLTATGFIPATQVTSNWFIKRRGTALGITSTGIGIGGLILAPVIGAYLIPSFGWRASYLAIAIFTWVLIIPITLLVIKERPSDIGLHPDGLEAKEAAAKAKLLSQTSSDCTLKMSSKTMAFWLIAIAFFAMNFSSVGIILHQVNYLMDIGFSTAMAATAHGVVGFASAGGKFTFGWLCDRMKAKYAAAISFAIQFVAIIILINLTPTTPVSLVWFYTILMGFGAGGWVPTMSMLISETFGITHYGSIYGVLMMAVLVSCASGPLVAGQMFDAMQTYYWVFVVFLILYMVAIATTLAIRRPNSGPASSG